MATRLWRRQAHGETKGQRDDDAGCCGGRYDATEGRGKVEEGAMRLRGGGRHTARRKVKGMATLAAAETGTTRRKVEENGDAGCCGGMHEATKS